MTEAGIDIKRFKELLNIFRDPLNVKALIEGKSGAYLLEKGKYPKPNQKFNLLRARTVGGNQVYILIAVVFLVRKFEGLVHDLPVMTKKETFRPSRDGLYFREWAYKLELQEPALLGVSGQAYWSIYDRLMKSYADYKCMSEAFKEECVFEPTHLFRWVRRLSELNEIFFSLAFPDFERRGEVQETREKKQHAHSRPRSPSADCGAMATLTEGSAKRRKTNDHEDQSGNSYNNHEM